MEAAVAGSAAAAEVAAEVAGTIAVAGTIVVADVSVEAAAEPLVVADTDGAGQVPVAAAVVDSAFGSDSGGPEQQMLLYRRFPEYLQFLPASAVPLLWICYESGQPHLVVASPCAAPAAAVVVDDDVDVAAA